MLFNHKITQIFELQINKVKLPLENLISSWLIGIVVHIYIVIKR